MQFCEIDAFATLADHHHIGVSFRFRDRFDDISNPKLGRNLGNASR